LGEKNRRKMKWPELNGWKGRRSLNEMVLKKPQMNPEGGGARRTSGIARRALKAIRLEEQSAR